VSPSLLVGVCGGSGSGKSTLAARVAEQWEVGQPGARAVVLSFDSYYHDQSHLPMAERALVNYDHPDSLDAGLMASHLRALRAGNSVGVPGYDFATYRRTGDLALVEPADLVLVEGILLFAFADLWELLDYRVFRNCPEPVRFERRLVRDTTERGRTVASVNAQLAANVKPMHDRYVQPHAEAADFVTEHGDDIDQVTARLLAELTARAAAAAPARP